MVPPNDINAVPLTVLTTKTFPDGTELDGLSKPGHEPPIFMAKGLATAETSLVGIVPVGLTGTGLAVVLSTVTACAAYDIADETACWQHTQSKQAPTPNYASYSPLNRLLEP